MDGGRSRAAKKSLFEILLPRQKISELTRQCGASYRSQSCQSFSHRRPARRQRQR